MTFIRTRQPMIKTLVREMPYIHQGIGLFGNTAFFVGSILFFKTFDAWYTFAVWLFVIGSFGMLLGSVGEIARTIHKIREKKADGRLAHTTRKGMIAGKTR